MLSKLFAPASTSGCLLLCGLFEDWRLVWWHFFSLLHSVFCMLLHDSCPLWCLLVLKVVPRETVIFVILRWGRRFNLIELVFLLAKSAVKNGIGLWKFAQFLFQFGLFLLDFALSLRFLQILMRQIWAYWFRKFIHIDICCSFRLPIYQRLPFFFIRCYQIVVHWFLNTWFWHFYVLGTPESPLTQWLRWRAIFALPFWFY